jgi:hypothetical protein
METVRIRKANATTEKEKVMYFARDRDVSTRILAILSVGQTKSGVKKEVIGADGKTTAIFMPEITRYKVICGSNGKVGTRYNVIKNTQKKKRCRVIKKTVIDNSTVGRRLTDEEFVNMYPSQCNIFKEIFKREFQVSQKIQKN